MRAQKWKIAAIVLAVVAGGAAYAWADVAATVNISDPMFSPLITNSGDPMNRDYRVYGWRFFVTKPMVITHIGVFGAHRNYQSEIVDDGLHTTHQMGIWGVKRAGGLELLRGPLPVGPGGTVESHYVYVSVGEPLTITPTDPTYDRLLIGVWTGVNNTDLFYHGPAAAQTLTAQQAGAIEMQNYTYYYSYNGGNPLENSTVFRYPWGGTLDTYHYFALNFKYNLLGPAAEAGPDVSIYTSEQAVTVINGLGTNTAPNTPMQYRWLAAGNVLQDWADVVADGAANLSLAAPVPAFSVGNHTLTLEVKDATMTVSDTMTLTVANTPPEAQLAPTYQVVEIGEDAILVTAEVADFDGDTLNYQWLKGGEVLDSGTMTPPAGGAVIALDDLTINAGDPRFPLGLNDVQLVVSDGVNPSVNASATTEVKDTTEPTLAPTPSIALLWPPNHALVPVTIWANTEDNGGGAISLAATVQSSEPLDAGGDGSTEEDCIVTSIDNAAGTVLVQLRAERSGSGEGRVYTVTITATDASGNGSTGTVEIRVPHDRRKK